METSLSDGMEQSTSGVLAVRLMIHNDNMITVAMLHEIYNYATVFL